MVDGRQLPIYCVQRDQKLAAISFGAAWGNEDTQQLIDILDRYNIKATFFVVGQWVDKYPESVKALHDAGHEVMNHSNTHAHYPQLSADQVTAHLPRHAFLSDETSQAETKGLPSTYYVLEVSANGMQATM